MDVSRQPEPDGPGPDGPEPGARGSGTRDGRIDEQGPVTLVFDWIPRWLDRGGEGEEFGVNVAGTIKLRAPRSRPGIMDRQWVWLLTQFSYPVSNISIESGKIASIFRYQTDALPGVKRGLLLAFLAHQMEALCDMATIILQNECEDEVPKDEGLLFKMLRQVSKERPQKVPDYICQDMMAVFKIKSMVSGSVDLDGATLDALAMELNRRNFVNDVARWFAEQYLGMSQFEIYWRRRIFRTLLFSFIIAVIFDAGRGCGSSRMSEEIQEKHCKDRNEENCSFCKKTQTSTAGSAR